MTDVARRRWRRVQCLSAGVLSVWLLVTLGTVYFARELDRLSPGLAFWAASQGAPLVYLGLVCLYARWMRHVDGDPGRGESA